MHMTGSGEELSDHHLLLQLALDDPKALEQAMHRYEARVFEYILRLVKVRELAEEITQDVFIKIWETRHTLPKLDSLPAWLLSLSRNRGLNILKERASRYMREQAFANSQEAVADTTESPAQYDLLSYYAGQLPPKRRTIFLLKAEKGLSNEEIAANLHISINTVKNQLHKAYQTLRKCMAEHALLLALATMATYAR
jgi:RNA polymerase sigma-70 factor (family 1)